MIFRKSGPGPDDAWRALATDLGVAPGAFEVTREWRKNDARRKHVIRLYSGPNDVRFVMKQVLRPDDAAAFEKLVLAQDAAATAMTEVTNRVPAVLAVDLASRAYAMEAVTGRTVFDMLEDGADHGAALTRAGAWLSAFHRAGFRENRVFQPKFMRNHLSHLLDQQARGDIEIAEAAEFERHARCAIDLAAGHEGQRTVSALTHGDMNLRNILVHGDSAAGIDISADHAAPVGYDIARLLLHYAALFGDFGAVPPGQALAPAISEAFFAGYTLVKADDPSVRYLLHVRLLMDWASIPAKPARRTGRQHFRLARLRELAGIAFPT